MNIAFGFTNGLRGSFGGAENQREDGVNKTHSLESRQPLDADHGGQHGPNGPPRDLTLRRSIMGNQGSIGANKGVSGRTAQLAFSCLRGPPPGTDFEHITQDTSPEHGLFGIGANRTQAAATGTPTMGVRAPNNKGVQLPQEPPQTGLYIGVGRMGMQGAVPAPQTGGGNGRQATPHGTNVGQHQQRGQVEYSKIGRCLEKLGQDISNPVLI